MRNIFFVLLLFVFGLETWGQTPPVITGLEKPNGFPLGTMVITGSGFDADPANLSVWLGGVEANVISSEENLIAITIPAMAQADNVTVINLATKKSAKSNIKAFSSFSGTGFDPVNLDAPVKFTESLQLFDLCACDINRDGKADIAITKFNAPLNSLKVLINESTPGNINFSAYPTNISINAPTADINCGDLNGDGWPELIATKGGSGGIDRNAIYIFPNNAGTLGSGIGLFLPAGTVTSEKVAIRDLNFDGLPELVITNSKTGELFLFKNTSTPTAMSFAKDPQIILLEGKEGSVGLEIQDLNDDQRPEIIVTANANFATDIIVLENTSTADQVRFKQLPPVNIDYLLSEIITVDFTNDGLLDVAASSLFSNKVVVLINKSSGGTVDFELPREFDSSGASGLSIADLDGDNLIDLLVSDTKGGSVAVFKNTSVAPAFDMQRIPVPVSNPTRNVLANDFDGDGKPDIAFTSEGGATFSVEILRNKHCYIPVLLGDTPLKICPGQTIPVKAIPSPGSTFAWSDGSSGTDPFYNMTAAGTISVTVTQEGGTCSNTSNVITFVDGTGTIPTPPVIPKIGTVCVGGTINLSA
ncbi:MAG: FG-GAP-like repeat-containing protein, partial [Cyclobacteriaceae bacterium]|nr:FG-GAP-like repeat-containing protein [Cyclobacteriaceae bacterium]